jgi:hypothetical protein
LDKGNQQLDRVCVLHTCSFHPDLVNFCPREVAAEDARHAWSLVSTTVPPPHAFSQEIKEKSVSLPIN